VIAITTRDEEVLQRSSHDPHRVRILVSNAGFVSIFLNNFFVTSGDGDHPPPRAFTSCTFETTLSNTESCGVMNKTGIFSSMRAIGRASSLPPDIPPRGCS